MRLMRSHILALLLVSLSIPAHAGVRATVGKEPRTVQVEVSNEQQKLYIVQLVDPPALVAHGRSQVETAKSGGAAKAKRFDPAADEVRRHISRLEAKQNELLLSQNLWQNHVYSYSYTFNGFAVKLTPSQAAQLRFSKGVKKIWEDTRRQVATNSTPDFLGLLNRDGGLRTDLGLYGEDVIIGIIDSGIAPNHPSFANGNQKKTPRLCRSTWAENSLLGMWLCRRFKDADEAALTDIPARWRGVCETGPGFSSDSCNNKLIGTRFYRSGFRDDELDPNEFQSPADADGHGTHIASIAAGNEVNAEVFGRAAGRISGMAPRARIAVYKACWLEPGAIRATCSVADLQAAIEDAVADGVDVINYSIGDSNSSIDDPDDLELLAAAEAGIISVVASGNGGPTPFSIQSPGTTPWVISAGATSRPGDRVAEALRITAPASLANDYESVEARFTPRLAQVGPLNAMLVLADDASTVVPEPGDSGSPYDACTEIQNDSELSGNIALIQRGDCNFDVKIANAQRAGAIAAIIYSNDMNLIVMDGNASLVDIPAVLIKQADGNLLQEKLLDDEAVAVVLDKTLTTTVRDSGNIVGSFSGRGPNMGDPDFLKPDVVAPGIAILGAQTPNVANSVRGEQFQYLTGTSQSAPHVAGLAALLKQAKPDWTPAEIKSALMTSARQNVVKEDGSTPAEPFDMGAGHVVPNSAVNPGLVYPVDYQEYDAYLCKIGLPRVTDQACTALAQQGYDQDARDINLPSVAISELTGTVTVMRRVRNTGPAAVYSIETDVPDGIDLKVTPASITLGEDETAEFTLQFRTDGSGLGQWHYGSFTWVSDQHRVYSPFIVQPALFSSPALLYGSGSSGSQTLPVGLGFDGSYAARVNGLFLPCVLPDANAADDACINEAPAEVADADGAGYVYSSTPPVGVRRFRINVPETDDRLLRVALYDELTDGNHDLDIYLHYCVDSVLDDFCTVDPRNVLASTNPGTSNELIDVPDPSPGTWIIDVHGYSTAAAQPARFRLYSWAFGSNQAAGNLTVSNVPAAAEAGTIAELSVNWANLTPGPWLGSITHYGNNDVLLDMTLVEIDNGGFATGD